MIARAWKVGARSPGSSIHAISPSGRPQPRDPRPLGSPRPGANGSSTAGAGAAAAERLVEVSPVVPTVGQDLMLDRLERVAAHGRSMLLSGPAGIGKTHLARVTALRRARMGWDTEEILGGASSAGVPLGACAHLVPVLTGEMPVAALIAATLDGLRRRAGEDGLVLVADDVDLLDQATLSLLAHLTAQPGIVVVATTRRVRRTSQAVADLVRTGRLDVVEVEPLARAATASLTATIVGGSVDPGSLRQVHHVTGGNPLWVVELLRAASNRQALSAGPNGVRIDTALARAGFDDLVAERLHRTDDVERTAIEVVAVAGTVPVLMLEAMVGDEATVALAAAGLFKVGGGRPTDPMVSLAHPLHRQSVLAGMDSLTRRSALQKLISAAEPSDPRNRVRLLRLAIWHAELGEHFDPAALGWAAREVEWGLFDLVRRHLAGEERSDGTADHRAVGIHGAEERAEVGLRLAAQAWREEESFETGLALARSLRFHPERAAEIIEVLDRLDELATTSEQRAWLAETRAVWRFWTVGDREGAITGLADAESSLDGPWRSIAASTRGGLLIQAGAIDAGLEILETARPEPDAPPASTVIYNSPAAAGMIMAGRFAEGLALGEAALPVALELGDHAVVAMAEILISSHFGRLGLGQYAATAASAHDIAEVLGSSDDDEGRSLFAGMEARARLFGGSPVTAAELAADAISWHGPITRFGFRPLLHTTRSYALAWTGRLDEARAEATEARRWSTPPRLFDAELDLADVLVLAGEGRRHRALQVATSTRDRTAELGGWYYAFEAAYLVVRLEPTARDLRALQAVAARVDGDPARLAVKHGAALIERDIEGLRQVAEEAREMGEMLIAIEVLEAARRAADDHQSWTLRTRLEADLGQLRAACEGARSPLAMLSLSPPELTNRETEVAAYAAKGWTSAAIADELSLSVRTVETHLYRVFTKLGVRAREELGDALARATRD